MTYSGRVVAGGGNGGVCGWHCCGCCLAMECHVGNVDVGGFGEERVGVVGCFGWGGVGGVYP